jgi:HK97 family phage major capsid protein
MLLNRNTPAVPVPETRTEANALVDQVNRGVSELRSRQESFEGQARADIDAVRGELAPMAQAMAAMEEALARYARPGAPAAPEAQSEERLAAFSHWLRTGDHSKLESVNGWHPGQAERSRGSILTRANTGLAESGPFGGYVILDNFDREIDRISRVFSGVRAFAKVVKISGGNTYEKATKVSGATARRTTESATRTATDALKWATNQITAHEAYAEPVYSRQVMADVFFDLMSEVVADLGEAYGVLEGAETVNGTGVGECEGFLKPAAGLAQQTGTTEVTPGKLGFVKTGHATGWGPGSVAGDAFDVFTNVRTALKTQYLARARYFMNRVSLGEIMLIKDSEGNPIWQPSMQVGVPSSLRGYSVALVEEMPDRGAGTFPVTFGDMETYYTILDRLGLDMLLNPFKTSGFITIETWKRFGGKVMKSEAMKAIKVSS